MCLLDWVGYWKAKINKSPVIVQIPGELIKAGCKTIHCEIRRVFLFGIRRICLRSGKVLSLFMSIRRATKLIVVITVDINFASYVQHFILHLAVKIKSICTGIYCWSSVWTSTQQANKWAYILHLICTWEMGIYWNRASAFYRSIQESLWFS